MSRCQMITHATWPQIVQVTVLLGRQSQYREGNEISVESPRMCNIKIYMERQKNYLPEKRNSINKGVKKKHDFRCVYVALLSTKSKKRRHDTGERETRK